MINDRSSKRRVTYRKYEIVRQLNENFHVLPFDELCFVVFSRERWTRSANSNYPEGILPEKIGPDRSYHSSFARTCKILQDEQRIKRWYCDIMDLPLSIIVRFALYRTGVNPFLSWDAYLGSEIRARVTLKTLRGLFPGKRNGYFIEVCVFSKSLQSVINIPITIPVMFVTSDTTKLPDLSPLAQSKMRLFIGSKEVSPMIGIIFGEYKNRKFEYKPNPKNVQLRESYRMKLSDEEQEYYDLGRPWVLFRRKLKYPGQQ